MKNTNNSNLIEKAINIFKIKILRFSIVGLANTLLFFMCYYLLNYLKIHFVISYFFSFLISVCISYLLNHKYVFKKNDFKYGDLLKTYIGYGFIFLINTFTLVLLVNNLKISYNIAPIINVFYSVPLNFYYNKYFIYRVNV